MFQIRNDEPEYAFLKDKSCEEKGLMEIRNGE